MAGSVNKVILVGNLGKDPEIRRTQDGRPIANLRVATTDSWRDKTSGERREKTEWHSVVIFNEGLCRVAEQYLKKGAKVYIEGALQTRKWQGQDGQDRYSTEVVLQGFNSVLTMLDGRSGAGASAGAGMQEDDQVGYSAPATAMPASVRPSRRGKAASTSRWTTRSRSRAGVGSSLAFTAAGWRTSGRSIRQATNNVEAAACRLLRCSMRRSPFNCTPSRRWRHSPSGWCNWPASRARPAPRAGLRVGRPDADRGDQLVLDPRDPPVGAVEPIHLLSILTLASLPGALYYAHTHQVRRHRDAMLGLFVGALVIAGLFTFMPGRIMHKVVFGG